MLRRNNCIWTQSTENLGAKKNADYLEGKRIMRNRPEIDQLLRTAHVKTVVLISVLRMYS